MDDFNYCPECGCEHLAMLGNYASNAEFKCYDCGSVFLQALPEDE